MATLILLDGPLSGCIVESTIEDALIPDYLGFDASGFPVFISGHANGRLAMPDQWRIRDSKATTIQQSLYRRRRSSSPDEAGRIVFELLQYPWDGREHSH